MVRYLDALLFLSPVSTLALQFSGPYCGAGDDPDGKSCADAANLIEPDTEYTTDQLIEAGDCSISATSTNGIGTPVSFKGQEWLDTLHNIVTNRCGFDNGWDVINGANVNVVPER